MIQKTSKDYDFKIKPSVTMTAINPCVVQWLWFANMAVFGGLASVGVFEFALYH